MTPRSRREIVAIRRERKALAKKMSHTNPRIDHIAQEHMRDIHFVEEFDFAMGWNHLDQSEHRKAAAVPAVSEAEADTAAPGSPP